jgi:hypothetical protein
MTPDPPGGDKTQQSYPDMIVTGDPLFVDAPKGG